MAKSQKFNVILIASHHGFFVTLKSLEPFKKEIGELIVVIPEDKIEKYKEMVGEEFANYQNLIVKETKSLKKTAKVFTAKFDVFRRVSQTAEFLREIKASGIWLQICAGSILNKMPGKTSYEEMKSYFLMMSPMRCYEGSKSLDMYAMLGQPNPDLHEKQNTQSFIMNAENIPAAVYPDFFLIREAMLNKQFKSAPVHAFSNPEELVEYAFNGKQLLDHAYKASKCNVADYWSTVMVPNLPVDQLYGYPLEVYLPYIEKCHGLIPSVTIHRIKQNATECSEYSAAFRKAIS